MQQNYPFIPRAGGATSNVSVGTSASALALPTTLQVEGGSIRLANIGTQTVFVTFTGTATVAAGMPILPNTVEMFTVAAGVSLSAIATATGSVLYVTVGDGA